MVSKLVCHDSERWLACLYLYVGADTRGIQLKTFECLHTAPSIFKLSNYGIHTRWAWGLQVSQFQMCTSTKIGPRVPIKRPPARLPAGARGVSRGVSFALWRGMLEEGFPRVCPACAVRPFQALCEWLCVGGGISRFLCTPPGGVVSRFQFITGKLEQNAAVSQFLSGEISKAKAPKQTETITIMVFDSLSFIFASRRRAHLAFIGKGIGCAS